MKNYILKIDCNDEKGLIYRISDIIFKHNLNIETNSEFVDHENRRFFFRAEIFSDVELNTSAFCGNLSAVLPNSAKISLNEKRKKNIVVLATKETHCLGDLLIKFNSGELDANILSVISNHDELRELVEKFNLPFHHISSDQISRQEHEKMVLEVMGKYKFRRKIRTQNNKYPPLIFASFHRCKSIQTSLRTWRKNHRRNSTFC